MLTTCFAHSWFIVTGEKVGFAKPFVAFFGTGSAFPKPIIFVIITEVPVTAEILPLLLGHHRALPLHSLSAAAQ